MPLSQHCLSRYLRSCDSLIIPHSFAFVKGFLKSFSNFFEVLFVPCHSEGMSLSALFGRPCYYTTTLSFCQGVFQKFLKNFFRFAFRSSHRSESPSPMRLPKALLFLPVNSRFFRCVAPVFWQLEYYTTFTLLCQYLFEKFFEFFGFFCSFSLKKHPSGGGVLKMMQIKQGCNP